MTAASEASKELRKLLVDMFSTRELRILVADTYPELSSQIAWDRPLVDVAFRLIEVLRAHGLAGEFFAAVIAARPRRVAEIAPVAKMFDVAVAAASPMAAEAAAPRRLICVVPELDSGAFNRLVSHISPLIEGGLITVESVSTAEALPSALVSADVVVVLLSVEFLATEEPAAPAPQRAASRLGRAMAEQLDRLPPEVTYVGAVLRACLWEATAFGRRRIAVSDPLEERPNGWSMLASRIADSLRDPIAAVEPPPVAVSPRPAPLRATSILRIFMPSGVPVHTLVETPEIRRLIAELSDGNAALLLEGPSGTGKTSAARAALERVDGERAGWARLSFHGKSPSDRARLDQLADGPVDAAHGFVLVDDFHELDVDQKRRLGRFAKAALDQAAERTKFVLVGINGMGSSLIQQVRDLSGGRATVIRFGHQDVGVVTQMITQGEVAANVEFARKAEIADEAGGSLMLAQLLCRTVLEANGIDAVREERRTLMTSVLAISDRLRDEMRGEFHDALQAFANLDRDTSPRGAGIAVLWSLSRSKVGSVTFADTRGRFADVDGAFDLLLDAVDTPGTWSDLLFCSRAEGRCAYTDPRLDFYLRHVDWVAFARDCGLSITLSPEQGPVFLAATRSPSAIAVTLTAGALAATPPPVAGVVRVLHLSDFHFRADTSWDSSTVLGRLSRDIAELRQDGWRADLIVLTGDIANSGIAAEYELATKWLRDELLPAAELDLDRLVVVPGNHDVDRKAVRLPARSLQEGLLDKREHGEVATVLSGPDRGILTARHRAFVEFLGTVGVTGRDAPWGVHRMRIRDADVRVAGFCSSFMACDDNDHGRLLLSLWQANELLRGADDDDLVIAAMHHPWAYFAEFDEPAHVEVRQGSDLVLRGHLHNAAVEQMVRPGGGGRGPSGGGGTAGARGVGSAGGARGAVEIAAGACYESSTVPNSYFALDVDLGALQVRLQARMWSPRARRWQRDRNLFDGEGGTLPLPDRRR